MEKDRLTLLIYKFMSDSLTDEEAGELERFIRWHPHFPELQRKVGQNREIIEAAISKLESVERQKNLEAVLAKIEVMEAAGKLTVSRKKRRRLLVQIVIVAAFIGLLALAFHFF